MKLEREKEGEREREIEREICYWRVTVMWEMS